MKPAILAILLISSSSICNSAEYSWDLSRDMTNGITTNPSGVWSFMQDKTGTGLQANFIRLPNYNMDSNITQQGRVNTWHDVTVPNVSIGLPLSTFTNGSPLTAVFRKGLPVLHPAPTGPAIIKWTSPIKGAINILGKVESFHKSCGGDGISFRLKWGDSTMQTGLVPNGGGSSFNAANLPVVIGSTIYFAVYPNGNNGCDSTNVDLLITGKD